MAVFSVLDLLAFLGAVDAEVVFAVDAVFSDLSAVLADVFSEDVFSVAAAFAEAAFAEVAFAEVAFAEGFFFAGALAVLRVLTSAVSVTSITVSDFFARFLGGTYLKYIAESPGIVRDME